VLVLWRFAPHHLLFRLSLRLGVLARDNVFHVFPTTGTRPPTSDFLLAGRSFQAMADSVENALSGVRSLLSGLLPFPDL